MKLRLGKMMWCSAWVMGAVMSVVADPEGDVFVEVHAHKGIEVPAGETRTVNVPVTVAPDGRLDKTGAGTLVLPRTQIRQNNTFSVGVREGTLELVEGTSAPAEAATPTELMNQAAFWVDSSVAGTGLVITNAGGAPVAARWCDCREANPSLDNTDFQYPYAEPAWDTANSTKPLYGVPPAVKEDAYGFRSVYFGKFGSTQAMKWKKTDGTDLTLSPIRQVFVVTAISNSWGFVLGNQNGRNADFHVGTTGGSIDTSYWTGYSGDAQAIGDGSRTYLNGTWIEGRDQKVSTGLQLLEVRLMGADANAAWFFSDRKIGGRFGGDYLYEMLAFTNRLSEAECQRIQRHLLVKWGLSVSAVPMAVNVATGATVRVSAETDLREVSLSGNGVVEKTGPGQLSFAQLSTDVFTGTLQVNGGSVKLGDDEISMAFTAGSRVTATPTYLCNQVEVTPGAEPATTVAQRGAGLVTISHLPVDVTTYAVSDAGTLCLAAPLAETGTRLLPGSVEDVTLRNGSFEENDYTWQYLSQSTKTNTLAGWSAFQNPEVNWTLTADRAVFFYSRSKHSTTWPCNYVSPDGDVSLAIKGACTAFTTFTAPEDGAYLLSVQTSGRNSAPNQIPFDVFVGTSESDLTCVGSFLQGNTAYVKRSFRTPRLTAGETYEIRFRARSIERDGCTLLDDVRLEHVTDEDARGTWTIPNGDFESHDDLYQTTGLAAADTLPNWTFNQGSWTGTVSVVGAIPRGFTSYVRIFTLDDFDDVGSSALFLGSYGEGWAETTFTPPAGTYYFAADAKRWQGIAPWSRAYTVRANPEVIVALTVAGSQLPDLTRTITNSQTQEILWPGTFTVPAGASVTVRLRTKLVAAHAVAILDNLRLVPAGGVNMLVDGSFELNQGWRYLKHAEEEGDATYTASVRKSLTDGFNLSNFGTDHPFGSYGVFLCQLGEVAQDVVFPRAGLYRLKLWAHARPDGPNGSYAGSGRNPLRAFIARDGQTNEFMRTAVDSTNFVAHTSIFRVSEAGTYTLGIQGCNSVKTTGTRDRTTILDNVSLTAADFAAEVPAVSKDLNLNLGADAKLQLYYPGTQEVAAVRLGGRAYVGVIDATTSENVSGPGALFVRPRGTVVIFR